ncbi:MAG: glycosyltransferase family 4 protein [Terracidiphilus sp.]
MRIAQVSPLDESVPPHFYGGTERVVSYLTEELVRQGHDVTLYASGDSVTSARLRATCARSSRLMGRTQIERQAQHLLLLETVMQEADQYEIIHFHLDILPFPLIRRQAIPTITTLHGRLDIPELFPLFREFDDMNLVSISDAQREPMPWASWIDTVYHGLPSDLYRPEARPGKYLAFLGRISPEKRVDRAIEIAKKAGIPLRIAAKVDAADQEYFNAEIRHLLDDPLVEFVGEIGDRDKKTFLKDALALVFPIDWPEPFGLVMIEAMACATPVLAFRGGSVGEVVEDGVTGYIVESIEDAVKEAHRFPSIDRRACRRRFDARFSAQRMATDYVNVYERVIEATQVPKLSLTA